MKLLVDGNNLIFKFPHLEEFMYGESMAGAREGLIELMAEYRDHGRSGENIVIFFDGRKEKDSSLLAENIRGIQIYYAQDDSADDLIKDYIKMYPRPAMLELVTSDKDILFYARRFKVKVHTSEEFAVMVDTRLYPPDNEDNRPDTVPLPEEVSFWKKLMGL